MAFPNSVVDQAWARAEGKCERCNKILFKVSRGKETSVGWEAHHKTRQTVITGSDTFDNCEILCQDCHKKTQSYGD